MIARLFLQFLACVPSASYETAEDSSRGADTAPTADTGETGVGAGWQPGDEIPGWPAAECGLTPTQLGEATVFPWIEEGSDPRDGMAGIGPDRIELGVHLSCTGTCTPSVPDPHEDGYFLSHFDAEMSITFGSLPGLGESTRTSCDEDVQTAAGGVDATNAEGKTRSTIVTPCDPSSTEGQDVAEFYECVSSFRPDRVTGMAWFDLISTPVYGSGYGAGVRYLAVTFDILVPPGSGYYAVLPAGPPDEIPEDAARHAIGYAGLSYDDAWPWGSITDPDVRRQVYELYAPVNPEDAP